MVTFGKLPPAATADGTIIRPVFKGGGGTMTTMPVKTIVPPRPTGNQGIAYPQVLDVDRETGLIYNNPGRETIIGHLGPNGESIFTPGQPNPRPRVGHEIMLPKPQPKTGIPKPVYGDGPNPRVPNPRMRIQPYPNPPMSHTWTTDGMGPNMPSSNRQPGTVTNPGIKPARPTLPPGLRPKYY